MASFFNCTNLLWLCQLQERISPHDVQLQQDINKLLVATQFSADATLNVVKYAPRALSSSVTFRCLLWLRNWQADTKSKWRLAASSFTGGSLFGESLEPILIENKDKRKVLLSMTRQADHRPSPYFWKPTFRAPDNDIQQQRFFPTRADRQSDRSSFCDKPRFQSQGKWPFRGADSCSFHRDK